MISGHHVEFVAAVALAAIPVVVLAMSEGGFYPLQWGWAAFGLGMGAVAFAVLRRELTISKRVLLYLGVLCAIAGWTAASLVWTRSASLSVLELERLLVYILGLGAAAVLVSARSARALVIGVYLATTAVSVWGVLSYLATREVAADVFQGSYLHRPMGYANAMAIVSVIALLLGLGIAAESLSRPVRVAAAVVLVPVAAALALTGSRAAWVALLVGGAATVAVARGRVRTLATWAWALLVPLGTIVVVSATDLTSSRVAGSEADRLGERVLVALVGLCALALVVALVATRAARLGLRWRLSHRLGLVLGVAAAAAAVLLGAGGMPDLAGDRPVIWRVALSEFAEHPLLGSGAGTFEQVWLERRPIADSVQDAHSLVVETLSELGPFGVVLVCLLLGAPLLWGARARARPLVPAATGAFAAYAVHAPVDWDWEMPAVTLAGLGCAVALAASADAGERPALVGRAGRRAIVAAGTLSAALALAVVAGASANQDANRALVKGDAASADKAARRAQRWQPWSAEPLLLQGQSLLILGRRDAARAAFVRAAAREPNDYRVWLALAAVSDGDAAQVAALRGRALNPMALRRLEPLADDTKVVPRDITEEGR